MDSQRPARRVPAWWFRLPVAVGDAVTLAAHVRAQADACAGEPGDFPRRALLTTAAQLEECAPRDEPCLRSVVANLDAQASDAEAAAEMDAYRYWDALAHAVERVADALGEADAPP